MASRRNRKAAAKEAAAYQIEAAISPTASDSIRTDKDSEIYPLKQSMCLKCPNWTRCVGYYQLKECTRKAQKEVRNE